MGRILSKEIINNHFDKDAEQIKRLAMPEAVERLLADCEAERQKFLQELESFGEVNIKEVGQQWTLMPQSKIYHIRKISGLSRNAFAEKYHIPIRTLEKWERSEITPADYLTEWLERIVREDLVQI
jgi:DNA-binding transcriptional regulator YiaG